MDALIMSCGMGGGHNAAGYAVKEELERRGHCTAMFNPYTLKSNGLARGIDNAYIRIAQKAPKFFGGIYHAAELYERTGVKSPVYALNGLMADRVAGYLASHSCDVIIMPHFFPAQMLMHLRRRGIALPPTILIATDYTCVPLETEAECDAYVIPAADLTEEFTAHGLAADKLHPLGIPVRHAFTETVDRRVARLQLGIPAEGRHILIAGGSIGAGALEKALEVLQDCIAVSQDIHCTALCGTNETLLHRLQSRFSGCEHIRLLPHTDDMPLLMQASDLFLSKPGGLSSTEAAVAGVPLIHMTPIPGCETHNMAYFSQRGMSIAVHDPARELPAAIARLQDEAVCANMRACQRRINPHAASDIADLAEQMAGGNT